MADKITEVYEKVKRARMGGRPTAKDYIFGIFDEFTEMHGDRRFADDHAVMAGLAFLDGKPVTVIGIEKGSDAEERFDRAFGCASPEGYRKALRQMKLAEKFGRPVVCIVDTQGANCGLGAEERGEGQAIAENLYEMMTLRTPILTLMVGEGGSGGALALAVADEVWMLENAYYSVVSPEACASILYKDAGKADLAAAHLRLTADDLCELGIVEQIVEETDGFSEGDGKAKFMKGLGSAVAKKLKELARQDTDTMLANRYEKYRKVGRYEESEAPARPAPKKRCLFGKKS